jgi:hypothetical protein
VHKECGGSGFESMAGGRIVAIMSCSQKLLPPRPCTRPISGMVTHAYIMSLLLCSVMYMLYDHVWRWEMGGGIIVSFKDWT